MADALQDLSNFYDMSGNVTMALRTAEESFCYRRNHDVPAILTFSNALYKAGEIGKAKNLLSQIKRRLCICAFGFRHFCSGECT